MRNKLQVFILLISMAWIASSCLDDNEYEYEYPNDTAITAFSLGTVDRYVHTLSSKGEDSVYTEDVDGSEYKFYIDQVKKIIYNPDSLPKGCDATRILATISSKNSGVIGIKDTKSDSIAAYSSSDSIDFSVPREIRAYNVIGTAYSAYTVTVNVHKEDPDSFGWHTLAQNNAELAALAQAKAVNVNERIYLFGIDATNNLHIYATNITDGVEWEEVTPDVSLSPNASQNAISFNGYIYTLTNGKTGTNLMRSADAKIWETIKEATELTCLAGASSRYLYALTPTGISVSKDEGLTWEVERIDTDPTFLPSAEISLAYTENLVNKETEHLLLMGRPDASAGQESSTVWTKVQEYAEGSESQPWSYVVYDQADQFKAPYGRQFLATAYRGGFEALHCDSDSLLVSMDKGITWRKDSVGLPTGFNGAHNFAFVKDEQNYLWIINIDGVGSAWKGRHNSEGWIKEETAFEN